MWLKNFIVAGGIAIAALQLAPGPNRNNPRTVFANTVQNHTVIPEHIYGILQRSCMNCHSNETRWPWYSYIAPMSWGLSHDVERARKVMNLSEWPSKPTVAISLLTAMCADVKSERMPFKKYLLLHPEAKLSDNDRWAICDWTGTEIERYRQARKKQMISLVSR